MKKLFIFSLLFTLVFNTKGQQVLNLDSCRALAIKNNKSLLISTEKITAAHYTHKAAATNFLPKLSATGAYTRNQKEFSLLSDEQKSGLQQMGTGAQGALKNAIQGIGAAHPELLPLLTPLGGIDLATPLNAAGQGLVDALRTDTRNVYVGAITLTQPIFMGGKISAYNKITKYAEALAHQQHNTELQEVILSSDQAYWQVISLVNKKKLAESYLQLLQKLEQDVEKMIAQGVATKSDGLTVKVKVNEAEMTLTRVEDGLSLSRMLLCQLCGLDLSTPITLVDEELQSLPVNEVTPLFNVDEAIRQRSEVKSLELASNIYRQKINVVRSEQLPTVALVGNYMISNPSVFNSFENKFKGMWSVGVMVQAPLWSWGESTYKIRAAKAEANIARYQLAETKEKITLQINQSAFKVNEAAKKLVMATKNQEKAEENLRYAKLGFEEGIIAPSNVLEAHTAWLSAQSEKIDAQIDVKLTEIYLQKSLGTLK